MPLLLLALIATLYPGTIFKSSGQSAAKSVPQDRRNQDLMDLNGYFPMKIPGSLEEWERRSEDLKRQLRVFLGLWPMPERTPMNPVIHGRIDMGDYSVEKVYFESFPGFYVTGNLYRPIDANNRKYPAALCPHGHWNNGRFMDAGSDAAQQEIQRGAESTEAGARSPLQARCVQLARMGAVVFHYDMIGYADSQQIGPEIAHRYAKQRLTLNQPDKWGIFSPQAESKLQNIMGLQTWNSIRALDFVQSLPDVDPERIGVTGASGGGTQTFVLTAVDARPQVAFPAVMVSTAMQGGCVCENASGMRVGTGNVEIAALTAPRPMGLTAANDWTVEMQTKGFPELKQLYALHKCSEKVHLTSRTEFGHNYNLVSRKAMYSWMNQWLGLGQINPENEQPFRRLEQAALTVWSDVHPSPASGEDFEVDLLKRLDQASEELLKKSWGSRESINHVYREAWETLLFRDVETIGDTRWELQRKQIKEDIIEMEGVVVNETHNENVHVLFLYPKNWSGKTAVWISPKGIAGLSGDEGSWDRGVTKLLEEGWTVVGVDLFGISNGSGVNESRKVDNPREFAGYTLGYNHPLFAQRVHDLLTVLNLTRTYSKQQSREVAFIGVNGAGKWAAAARVLAGHLVDYAMIDTDGFRFENVSAISDPDLLPGASKYGDMPGLIALSAPYATLVLGESEPSEIVSKFYETFEAGDKIHWIHESDSENRLSAGLDWLIKVSN